MGAAQGGEKGRMKKINAELAVGLFMIVGILCLGYLSVKLGKLDVLGSRGYEVVGVFSNCGGVRVGSVVSVAGVQVCRVKTIALDGGQARVTMMIDDGVKIPTDSIASIKTRGLIGEKFIELTLGAEDANLQPGQRIRETQPPVDLESLIAKYAFGKV
jgi:phospholipid/cholesterol/gamma-HCH transport system substrate-binding protein